MFARADTNSPDRMDASRKVTETRKKSWVSFAAPKGNPTSGRLGKLLGSEQNVRLGATGEDEVICAAAGRLPILTRNGFLPQFRVRTRSRYPRHESKK